ncbi:hypothetical protein Tco_0926939 [Tanacetum coccineum]|uniref:Uncharacterized protein n=1 Tax=Tanacetum coccineum TaxID=301880 RepID=A0ABQ5DC79_9ASTR
MMVSDLMLSGGSSSSGYGSYLDLLDLYFKDYYFLRFFTVVCRMEALDGYMGSAPGQNSMADIVKMGRSQNKVHTTPNPSQQSINWGLNSGQSNLPFDRSNQYVGYETNEAEPQHKSSSEDHIEDHDHDVPVSNEPLYEHDVPVPVPAEPLYDHSSYRTMDSYQVVNHVQKLRRKSALAPTDSVEVYFSSLDDDRKHTSKRR